MTLYHYTTQENYQSIMKDNFMRPTRFSEKLDANFGEGWYFTNLHELTDKELLEKSLWGTTNKENQAKCQYYLKFEIAKNLIEEGRANVFILPISAGIPDEQLGLKTYKKKDRIVIEYIGGGECLN